MHLRKRAALLTAVLATAAIGLGSVAYAAIPDAGGTIHGCYDKSSGQLRVTDTQTNLPKNCSSKENPLAWAERGPQGVQGVQGVPGAKGDAGDPGGVSHVKVWRSTSLTPVGIQKIVGAMLVTTGKYLLTAKVDIGSSDNFSVVSCSLIAYPGGLVLDQSQATIYGGPGAGASETSIFLSGAATVGIGDVQAVCTAVNGFTRNVTLTALPVDAVWDAS
jgi:hypothetical protein